jgi:hypothetical protein
MQFFPKTQLLLLSVSLLFAGCASDDPPRTTSAVMPPPSIDDPVVSTTIVETTTETVKPVAPGTETVTDPVPVKNLPTKKGHPYAIKTKWPGLVKSPFAQEKTLVDVGTLTPDSPARCPHTGKIFIVP